MIGRLEDRIQVYGAARSAKTKRNFIIRSTIPQRRTGNISRSWRECQKRKSSGAVISSWII